MPREQKGERQALLLLLLLPQLPTGNATRHCSSTVGGCSRAGQRSEGPSRAGIYSCPLPPHGGAACGFPDNTSSSQCAYEHLLDAQGTACPGGAERRLKVWVLPGAPGNPLRSGRGRAPMSPHLKVSNPLQEHQDLSRNTWKPQQGPPITHQPWVLQTPKWVQLPLPLQSAPPTALGAAPGPPSKGAKQRTLNLPFRSLSTTERVALGKRCLNTHRKALGETDGCRNEPATSTVLPSPRDASSGGAISQSPPTEPAGSRSVTCWAAKAFGSVGQDPAQPLPPWPPPPSPMSW